jgi:hypothetical protein
VLGKESVHFPIEVGACLLAVGVVDDDLVSSRAGNRVKWHKSAIREMATAPKINSSSVAVLVDKPGVCDVDVREVIVVAVGVDQRRANSQEGDNEGPRVSKAWLDATEGPCANQGAVGVGPSIVRDDSSRDVALDDCPVVCGENEEEADVGEDRGDEHVNIRDPVSD